MITSLTGKRAEEIAAATGCTVQQVFGVLEFENRQRRQAELTEEFDGVRTCRTNGRKWHLEQERDDTGATALCGFRAPYGEGMMAFEGPNSTPSVLGRVEERDICGHCIRKWRQVRG